MWLRIALPPSFHLLPPRVLFSTGTVSFLHRVMDIAQSAARGPIALRKSFALQELFFSGRVTFCGTC